MTSAAQTRAARFAGLDGLRAIAVSLVIAYHLFPAGFLRGGFIGVDVFFVISGFLITSLLLTEHERRGRIGLRGFWTRRARRLLPAIAVLVVVCASIARMIGGDVLVRMGWQVLGTATFSYNWLSIAGGSDYFAAATPELFRNLWSLAVEEQFYLLWPLLLPLVLLLRRRRARIAVTVVAAVASAAWMAVLVAGGDVTRAYFGTDSHAFGLLLGVALALALRGWLQAPPAWTARRAVRVLVLLGGIAALAGIVALGMLPATDTPATFPGVLLGAAALTAVAIVAGVWPGARFGALIDLPPLRWVGDRSYGLYLWHWPLLVLVSTALIGTGPGSGVPPWIGVLTLVLTVVIAEASYRFVEQPVRRHGFRGSVRRIGRALTGRPGRRLATLAALVAGVLALGGTAAAVTAAPPQTAAQRAVEAGIAALAKLPPRTPLAAPAPAPSATTVTGDQITAVGDSVMLASAPALMERLPGIQIDAAVSRSMYAGPGILEQLAAAGALRPYVVVALGTNGAIQRDTLDRIAGITGPDRELVLVNAVAPRDWIPGVNDELRSFAAGRDGVTLADWSRAIGPRPDLLAGDGVHPGSEGGRLFADAVADAVDTAATLRASRDYRAAQRAYLLNQGIRPIEPQ